ncbi:hypothetical protein OS493_029067 [Desmophyllum pertusum]|uniref:U1-type domain-containing protein n=1 Tax=Desmophyllum pertusum TaxID=174260 RepID=A0A9X0CKR7_9CNID|nr:hypothetical protein OS493_029067 [Desmophyllum pertusum]
MFMNHHIGISCLQKGLPGMSGGSGLGSGLTAQLAQQQQQLMAMVQTQSLLAAMQAQANANAQAQVHAQGRGKPMPSPLGGLLPTPLIPRTDRARDMQRQNRKRRNDGWGGGGGGNYGNKRERFDRNRGQQGNNRWGQNQQNRGRPGGVGAQNQQAKKAAAPDEKETKNNKAAEKELQEEETEEEGEDTQELDASQEEDKDDQEKGTVKDDIVNPDLPKSVNFIGEDVDSLMISLFDRQRSKYICQECKIICNLPTSFHKHLLGKRHARTVLENQGKEFDMDEFKSFSQGSAPAEKSETDEMTGCTKSDEREKVGTPEVSSPPPIQSPGVETNLDFVKYTCDTRKTAMKEGDIITISSVTQSRVKIDGFTSGRNMLGCEFVKAVSGFNCRLCKAFIRCGNDVISHIKGKKHQRNYQVQITKFVVAPQSTDEAAQLHINCEAHDVVDLDFGDIEHMNDDSLLTEEGEDELLGTPMATEEEELNDNPAEQTGVEESPANELTLSIIAPQLDYYPPLRTWRQNKGSALPTSNNSLMKALMLISMMLSSQESEDFIPLSVDEPVTSEEVDVPKSPLSITPRLTDSQDNEKEESQESEIPGSSQEEIEDITPKENTPTPTLAGSGRRGKKSVTRGGAGRGGAAREEGVVEDQGGVQGMPQVQEKLLKLKRKKQKMPTKTMMWTLWWALKSSMRLVMEKIRRKAIKTWCTVNSANDLCSGSLC